MSEDYAVFTLYVPDLQDVKPEAVYSRIRYALSLATSKLDQMEEHDPERIGWFQNITDANGDVIGSFATKDEQGMPWWPH